MTGPHARPVEVVGVVHDADDRRGVAGLGEERERGEADQRAFRERPSSTPTATRSVSRWRGGRASTCSVSARPSRWNAAYAMPEMASP